MRSSVYIFFGAPAPRTHQRLVIGPHRTILDTGFAIGAGAISQTLNAGDVNDNHVAVKVVVLVGGEEVGVDERSVELICHDDFVVDCLRSQKSGHLTPEQGTAIQARSRDYFASFGNLFCLKT
jgi:hypothetical protein